MNIDDIESGLNSFPADQQEVLAAILNISIKNQAIQEATLALLVELTRADVNKIESNIQSRISEIQAETASKFNSNED